MLLGIPGHIWKTSAVKHVLYVKKELLSYAVSTFVTILGRTEKTHKSFSVPGGSGETSCF